MNKIKIKGSTGNIYEVDWNSCTCPHFIYRCKSLGKSCKHIDYVRKHYPKMNPDVQQIKKINKDLFKLGVHTDNVPYTQEELNEFRITGQIIYDRKVDKYYLLE